jgi:hypothetical protein
MPVEVSRHFYHSDGKLPTGHPEHEIFHSQNVPWQDTWATKIVDKAMAGEAERLTGPESGLRIRASWTNETVVELDDGIGAALAEEPITLVSAV